MLIFIPALFYLLCITIMRCFGCRCCDEKLEDQKKMLGQSRALPPEVVSRKANFSFDKDPHLRHSASKRFTMSNPRGREQFIEESMHENDEMQRQIHNKQIAQKEKLAKRKVVRRERSQQNIPHSMPSGADLEMPNI